MEETHKAEREEVVAAPPILVRKIDMEAPWRWLAAGWSDLWRVPRVSFLYGAIFAGVSALLTIGLVIADLTSLVVALAGGFLLVGPMLAVGLYEASRRLEAGEEVALADVLFVATRSPTQLAFLGVVLMLMLLAWIRVATLLFALFFGTADFPPLDEFVPTLLFTAHGLGLLIVGTTVGAGIAFAVFSVSAVSVPMLIVRDIDTVTAVITSIKAVRENFAAMLLWAWLIAIITAFGIVTLYIGLIVAFPLIGHATWHAFRSLVPEEAGDASAQG